MQPVLVFTEADRPMGLAVDEIVDIVEEPLTIEIATDKPGLIGAAIVRGNATEIVDVSHYLAKGIGAHLKQGQLATKRDIAVLLVDDSQFFRNMLAPLLEASGYRVTAVGSAEEALALKEKGAAFDLIISDLEMPGMDGIAFAEPAQGGRGLGQDPDDRAFVLRLAQADRADPECRFCQPCGQVRSQRPDGYARGMLQEMELRRMTEQCAPSEEQDFVTVVTAGQVFGLDLDRVRDVFVPRGLSPVPLAPNEVAGLLNLRGRIVTAVDLRRRLGLGPRHGSAPAVAVGIEERGELYGLVVDRVGEVLQAAPISLRGQPRQSRRALGGDLPRRLPAG